MHAIHTACGIETKQLLRFRQRCDYCMQSIPLAVLKLLKNRRYQGRRKNCMQSIPLAVLKLWRDLLKTSNRASLHAIHTACGIETIRTSPRASVVELHAIHTACGIETVAARIIFFLMFVLHAIHTACGIETVKISLFVPHWEIAGNPYRWR